MKLTKTSSFKPCKSWSAAALGVALALFGANLHAAGGGTAYHLEEAPVNLSDRDSVLRGAVLFSENCLGCHSAQLQRYNRLAKDYDLNETQLRGTVLKDADAKLGDHMVSAMPPADAQAWLGKAPPDLSLIARSRTPEYLYNFMRSFYKDTDTATGSNNAMLPNTAMPNVLAKYQTTMLPVTETSVNDSGNEVKQVVDVQMVKPDEMSQARFDEVEDRFDQVTKDLTNFLVYIGEPSKQDRHALGFWVIVFMLIFSAILYQLKKSYWKHIH